MASILFVCTANRFRSPIAALYFAREVVRHGDDDQITVSSAGTWAKSGMPAMPKAVQLGEGFDLDLGFHRSRVITERILSKSDLILVMEAGHKEAITHEFPGTQGRVFLLTEAVGKLAVDIPDPYGEKRAPPEDVIKEIVDLIDHGYEQIVALAKTMEARRFLP
ncbi:MAG: low molecular weight phosphotyrosine protein phosphatase [Chloroflexota bacterium]|nr:low molecular weight phosphotyrosine protein phosphatase [Chloroflexota bacterium]